jgi:6-phosphogluconolactonase
LNNLIKIFASHEELAMEFADEFIRMINLSIIEKRIFTVALSGGNTPKLLFSILGEMYSDSVSWDYVHFFWGDERCVPPGDPESNFGMTKKLLFDKISVPSKNIHRIFGEQEPSGEAVRYSDEIAAFTRNRNGLPVFNLILLGLGEDGHTASLFTGSEELFKSEKVCVTSVHPVSLQRRITLTGSVINNSENIFFLVNGSHKAKVVSDIIERPQTVNYPAAFIKPLHGVLNWYLDSKAAAEIAGKTAS